MGNDKGMQGRGWKSGTERVVACYQSPEKDQGSEEKLYVILEAKDNANQRIQFSATVPQHEFVKHLTNSENFRIDATAGAAGTRVAA